MRMRFLLHGGRTRRQDERNDSFFRELTKGLNDGDVILSIGFAQSDRNKRLTYFERDKRFILAQAKADIRVVSATYDDLESQIQTARCVYVPGGEIPELVNDIMKYPNFTEWISGKSIGGVSAGACLFSTYYLNCPKPEIRPGLGILPIRLAVHYENSEFNSTDETARLLEEYSQELELLRLKECEWVVKEVDL